MASRFHSVPIKPTKPRSSILQGAGKGDQHIGFEIPFRADKADKAEKQHLNKEYALPPVQAA